MSGDQLKLQKNIRTHAVKYLKEFLFKLPVLPSVADYEKLVERNERDIFENLKTQINERNSVTKHTSMVNKSVSFKNSENADDWVVVFNKENNTVADECEVGGEDDELIRMQIKVFEKHLEDACRENRFDDIEICKKNLNELSIILNSRSYKFI